MQILKGALPPAVLALAFFSFARRQPVSGDALDRRWVLAPLLVWLIVAISWAIAFKVSFPPADSFSRLPLLYLAIALSTAIFAFRPPRLCAVILGLLVTVGAGALAIPAATEDLLAQALMLAGAALPLSLWQENAIAEDHPRAASLSLMILAGGAAQVLLIAFSSLKLGQAAGIFASLGGGIWLLSLLRRPVSIAHMRWMIATCVLVTLFQALSVTSAAHPWVYVYCIGWAPLAGCAAHAAARRVPRWQPTAYVGGVLLSVVIALGIAFAHMTSSEY